MIKKNDLESLARDVSIKLKEDVKNVAFELNDLKNDQLKVFLKYIRSSNNYAGNNNQIVVEFDFQIRGKRGSSQFLAQLITLELNLRKNITIFSEIQRNYNFEDCNKLQTENADIRYYILDNEDDPETNETENNILDYLKTYKMKVLFKLR